MRGTVFRLDVRPTLPSALRRLEELANDLWYSWDRPTRNLFARLDPELWQVVGHSPKAFLRTVAQDKLERAAEDPVFLIAYHRVLSAFDSYQHDTARAARIVDLEADDLVAYFCAEFGLHDSLPIYSGGLGILAGDHCKTASDLRMPFVGIGLLYRQGYFQQTIDGDSRQHAHFTDTDFELLPVTPVLRPDGSELRVSVDFPGRAVHAKVWQVRVGHISIYLLDTDIELNSASDRDITHRLYVGGNTRLEQELVLGVGGVRALAELGLQPSVWHINEGHSAFQAIERIRAAMGRGLSFDEALELVAASTVFTTHTAVPAGHDHFADGPVREYLKAIFPEFQGNLEAALALGHSASTHDFNMTSLAVRTSRFQNGVSRIHGSVSARICAELWPQIDPDENPLQHITNGVHVPTFLASQWHDLFDGNVGPDWSLRLTDMEYWQGVHRIPNAQFWNLHQQLKSELLHLVRYRVGLQHTRNQGSEAHLERMLRLADPANQNVLTIGFARRFATYKRAMLLFDKLDWLREIVGDPARPVLLLFSGKAHPDDHPAQEIIRRIGEVSRMPEFESKILLVEGYDLRLARRLVSGVDVWLNNPVFPLEASGTSGMKAGLNGVLNLSVLDGWWGEAYNGRNGWAIKPASSRLDPARRDEEEARTLYELLQDQVLPLYYSGGQSMLSPGWISMMKESMASVLPRFSSNRMVLEYVDKFYAPAAKRSRSMAKDNHAVARTLAAWKAKVRSQWHGVSLRRLDEPGAVLRYGTGMPVRVAVRLNGLAPEDVTVEIVATRPGVETASESVERTTLRCRETVGDEHVYATNFAPDLCGRIEYRIRAYPCTNQLTHPFEMGLMLWL